MMREFSLVTHHALSHINFQELSGSTHPNRSMIERHGLVSFHENLKPQHAGNTGHSSVFFSLAFLALSALDTPLDDV